MSWEWLEVGRLLVPTLNARQIKHQKGKMENYNLECTLLTLESGILVFLKRDFKHFHVWKSCIHIGKLNWLSMQKGCTAAEKYIAQKKI